MAQGNVWEKEYKNSKLVTKDAKPQKFFLRFLKFLRKETDFDISKARVLDLGCGTGKLSNYLAELGADVVGIEISGTAIDLAKERAEELKVKVDYRKASIGDEYPFEDNSFDLILDITSSNSLSEKERLIYLQEVARVIKDDGYFFVRSLRKEGDKNAKNLLKKSPGKEYDTYIMPDLGLAERVFSDNDFNSLYAKYFKIKKIINESGYSRIDGKKYKRNFRLAYMQK